MYDALRELTVLQDELGVSVFCTDFLPLVRGDDSQFSSRIRGNSVLEMNWDLENSPKGIGIAGNNLAITGNVKLIPLDGRICLDGGHDRFPSYEIYHDVGGDTRTLYQREQARILGATGLFDPIPDARFPACEVGGLNPPSPQQMI